MYSINSYSSIYRLWLKSSFARKNNVKSVNLIFKNIYFRSVLKTFGQKWHITEGCPKSYTHSHVTCHTTIIVFNRLRYMHVFNNEQLFLFEIFHFVLKIRRMYDEMNICSSLNILNRLWSLNSRVLYRNSYKVCTHMEHGDSFHYL